MYTKYVWGLEKWPHIRVSHLQVQVSVFQKVKILCIILYWCLEDTFSKQRLEAYFVLVFRTSLLPKCALKHFRIDTTWKCMQRIILINLTVTLLTDACFYSWIESLPMHLMCNSKGIQFPFMYCPHPFFSLFFFFCCFRSLPPKSCTCILTLRGKVRAHPWNHLDII